jgi:hypothetical protein
MKIQYLIRTKQLAVAPAMHLAMNGEVDAAPNRTRMGNNNASSPGASKKR